MAESFGAAGILGSGLRDSGAFDLVDMLCTVGLGGFQ